MRKLNYFYNNEIILLGVYRICHVSFRKLAPCITNPIIFFLSFKNRQVYRDEQYFSYTMATSFSGGGSRSTRKEPPTLDKQLIKFITCGC